MWLVFFETKSDDYFYMFYDPVVRSLENYANPQKKKKQQQQKQNKIKTM